MRTAHGNKYYFLFFQRSRSRRAYLPERYHHRHCRLVTRPPGCISCRRCGRIPRGFLFLSPPHVRIPCHPRYPLRRHVPYRWQVWKRQLPCRSWSDHPRRLIAIAGYTLGKAYVYSTWEYAMLKLPFEILQAFIGSAIGLFLWKNRKWGKTIRRFLGY